MSHYRLAFHLTLACVIYAAILWTAQQLGRASRSRSPAADRASALGLMVLVLVQIYLGALVAGLRAGLIYNTWPLIDGPGARRVPAVGSGAVLAQPVREPPDRAVRSPHGRLCAAVARAAACRRCRPSGEARRGRRHGALAVAATLQAVLGILTLLHQVPIALALAHQAMAILVLTIAVVHAQRLERRQVADGTEGRARVLPRLAA